MTLIVVGDQSPNNLKVMTMMTRVQECKYYIGACNFKGLFIYYVISDGGGLPDLLQYNNLFVFEVVSVKFVSVIKDAILNNKKKGKFFLS